MYTLEPYKGRTSRYECPNCLTRETFVRYIDPQSEIYVSEIVGRCNRQDNCGYHFTPKQFFDKNPELKIDVIIKLGTKPKKKDISFIDPSLVIKSLKAYDKNNFIIYLTKIFSAKTINQVINNYRIGTSKHWPGSTIFWQLDITGKCLTGKIMLYDINSGKRVKVPYSHTTWVHSRYKDFELKQCFYGEHLLNIYKRKTVAIVESEKTAIIASVYFPNFIWLATGGKDGLGNDKSLVLKGRKVILFPDVNAFDKWTTRAIGLSYITKFAVSDLLELNATKEDRIAGVDLADHLLKFDFNDF
jgi:Domain of unknown function (DUF6371)